jgi:hypothetical protein
VKAYPCGDIDVVVGVMHLVKPPQDVDGVEYPVLQVDGEVEQHDGNGDLDQRRSVH